MSLRKCIDGCVSEGMWQYKILDICYSVGAIGSRDVWAALCCDARRLLTELHDWLSSEYIQTYKNMQMETGLHGYIWRKIQMVFKETQRCGILDVNPALYSQRMQNKIVNQC